MPRARSKPYETKRPEVSTGEGSRSAATYPNLYPYTNNVGSANANLINTHYPATGH
jgi:hypothetical protein